MTYLQGRPLTVRVAQRLLALQELLLAVLTLFIFFGSNSIGWTLPSGFALAALSVAAGRARRLELSGVAGVLVIETAIVIGGGAYASRGDAGASLAGVAAVAGLIVALVLCMPPSIRAVRAAERVKHPDQQSLPTDAAELQPATGLDVLAQEERTLAASPDADGPAPLAPPPSAAAQLSRRRPPLAVVFTAIVLALQATLLVAIVIVNAFDVHVPSGTARAAMRYPTAALLVFVVRAAAMLMIAGKLWRLSRGARVFAVGLSTVSLLGDGLLFVRDHRVGFTVAPLAGAAGIALYCLALDGGARRAFRLGHYVLPPPVELPPDTLYEIRELRKHFPVRGGLLGKTVAEVQAVTDVSLTIKRGETLGIVGESGCGKTTLGRLLLRLIEPTAGQLLYEGRDLRAVPPSEMKRLRQKMQIIFQDPYASLNPRLPIGDIIGEGLYNAGMHSRVEREKRVSAMLERVGLRKYYINRYPHEFSGGQRQRIGIARALVTGPTFVVADEPVSALDVSIQSQVLNLLEDLQQELQLTLVFISHNLQVVQHVSDRVGVMYLGKLVELAPAAELYADPKHPYTQALLSAIPLPDPERRRERILIRGDVPSAISPPTGCRFHTRCPIAQAICAQVEPTFEPKGGKADHLAACHFSDSVRAEALAAKAAV